MILKNDNVIILEKTLAFLPESFLFCKKKHYENVYILIEVFEINLTKFKKKIKKYIDNLRI